jgi:hypothetical protein
MPVKDLKKLLERIHTRLDDSSVGISHGFLSVVIVSRTIRPSTLGH